MRTLIATVASFGSLVALVAVGAGAGCGGDDAPLDVPAECNPLGGPSCLMPWPSAAYLVDDATTATGVRLDLPEEAMPVSGASDEPIHVDFFNRWDGFSPSGPIVAAFPGGVVADGLPDIDHPEASLAADSPIVLLNMDTGERAPFFAEVDMNVKDATLRPVIIRPVERLAGGTRYAVAITRAVKGPGGADLPVPAAFAALRDGTRYRHPRMERLTPRYDAIFAALDTAGVAKDDLVLAWDFVTASDAFLTSDMLAIRSAALPAMGDTGEHITVDLTEEPGDASLVYKLYSGTLTSPNFLTNDEADDSILLRDSAGAPRMQGMRDANVTAIVPACVTTAQLPIPVMLFGHGLFGNGEGYLNDRFLQQVAQDYCFVVLAGDFIGLTDRQLGAAALTANDLNKAPGMTEKLMQSVIDFIAIERAARGPMHDSSQFAYNGTPIIDPSRVYYFGASLGGIMGTNFMAYDPTVTRGVLGVPGGPWSMLFERSYAWNALSGPAHAAYPDPVNFQILISLLGMRFEPIDPITAAPHLLANPFPDTPTKQILLYETMGDCLVANITSETLARTIGLPVVMPSLKEPYGLVAAGADAPNGFAVYDEHPMPLPGPYNTPPSDDNGTHGGVHSRPAVLRQIQDFLYDGVATNECGGTTAVACDCATGACE